MLLGQHVLESIGHILPTIQGQIQEIRMNSMHRNIPLLLGVIQKGILELQILVIAEPTVAQVELNYLRLLHL